MSLSVNIQWDKELSLKLKKLSESDLLAAKNKILRTAAILLQWESKKLVPIDTWVLRKSIFYRINKDHAQVYYNVSYALYVHEWTRPYTIRAKKKVLYWIDESSKVWVFAKKVNHPWIKANSFFTRALEKNEKKIVEMFYSIIDDCINDKWA